MVKYQRVFEPEDQKWFAVLSGDNNPVHLDSVQARRLLFGKPVVHGIHLLMWALDSLLVTTKATCRIESMTASFRKPVYPGDQVTIAHQSSGDNSFNLEVTSVGETKAKFEIELCPTVNVSKEALQVDARVPLLRELESLQDDDYLERKGTLFLHLPQAEYQQLFPNCVRWLEPTQAATLLAISRLVGTECPGLNSILHQIQVSDRSTELGTSVRWRVTEFDERTRRLPLSMESSHLSGELVAFVRPEPVRQPDSTELGLLVHRNEFSTQHALVVGASRGLGEVVAKLLALGGSRVTATYNLGKDDASRVAKDVEAVGGDIQFLEFDVTKSDPTVLLDDSNLIPTSLYYCCSPKIPMDRTGVFSTRILEELLQYYVVHFIEMVNVLAESNLNRIFYPSTVALNDMPLSMREYAVAKSAGEAACASIEVSYPNISMYSPRLPRIQTDQTASILPVRSEDISLLVLKHLRNLSSQNVNI